MDYHALTQKPTTESSPGGEGVATTPSRGDTRAMLRGKTYDEQVQMLAPGGPGSGEPPPAGEQEGPTSNGGPGGSKTGLTALDASLERRGKVAYVDPKYGKGKNHRPFTQDEVNKLEAGGAEVVAASCSPFTYWALQTWATAENEGKSINDEIEPGVTVKDVINVEWGARKGVKNDKGEAASWSDIILGRVSEEDEWRGHGVAGAIAHAGWGYEVPTEEGKPGDFCQTWVTKLDNDDKFVMGGHSTQIHRVHAQGGAWFGNAGSPQLERIDPGADGFSALVERGICDASGAPADAPSMPVYVRDCMFRIDETTDPGQVGAHTVKTHELIGAHNGGKNADTGKADSGVFTREAEDLNVKDTPGAKRVYLGRLNDSPWAQFEPAPDHFDIEKMAPRKVGRIEMSQPDEMPKIPVSAPNPVPDAKGKKGKKGKKGG